MFKEHRLQEPEYLTTNCGLSVFNSMILMFYLVSFLCQFPWVENVYNDTLLGWFLLWFKDSVWHNVFNVISLNESWTASFLKPIRTPKNRFFLETVSQTVIKSSSQVGNSLRRCCLINVWRDKGPWIEGTTKYMKD